MLSIRAFGRHDPGPKCFQSLSVDDLFVTSRQIVKRIIENELYKVNYALINANYDIHGNAQLK